MKLTLRFSFLLTALLAFIMAAAYFSAPVHAAQTLPGGSYKASSLGSDPDIVFTGDASIVMDAPLSAHSIDAGSNSLTISGKKTLSLTTGGDAISAGNLKIEDSILELTGNDCLSALLVDISDSMLTLSSKDDCISGDRGVTLKNCSLDLSGDYGLYSPEEDISVENCSGIIQTKYTSIHAFTDLTIAGSELNLTSDQASCLYVNDNGTIEIRDSGLKCTASSPEAECILNNGSGNIIISGSDINIFCRTEDTVGIYAKAGGFSAEGSKLTIQASSGIQSTAYFSLKDTDLDAAVNYTAVLYRGTAALNISGGSLKIRSGSSNAICTENADIVIKDASFDMNADLYSDEAGDVKLTNCSGKIITTGFSALCPYGNVVFTSCDLTLTSDDEAVNTYRGTITLSDDNYVKSPRPVTLGPGLDEGSTTFVDPSSKAPCKTVIISKKRLSDELCTVDPIPGQTYEGTPVTPAVVVKWDGKVLVRDKDYTVKYTGNTSGGTGTAVISGKGNYTGSVSRTFQIKALTGAGGTALGKGASAKLAETAILSSTSDEGPAGSVYNGLQAKAAKVTKSSIKLTWKKVKGAKTYIIYGNKCGKGNKFKRIASVSASSYNAKKAAGKKLKKGTYYKFLILAVDSKDKVVTASKSVHAATAGGKVGNNKKVTTKAKKNKVTVKKGKSFKLGAKAKAASKKLKVRKHRGIKYESTNAKVAKVSAKGVIKGVKKGTCYVYAYTQDGISAKIKVTVK